MPKPTDLNVKNESFNCSNGDVLKWKHLWKVLAELFEIENYGFDKSDNRLSLTEMMKDMGPVWDEIVRENELVPTEIWEVAAWQLIDMCFQWDYSLLDTMNKSKEHGFMGFRNTKTSFVSWIDKMRARRIIP